MDKKKIRLLIPNNLDYLNVFRSYVGVWIINNLIDIETIESKFIYVNDRKTCFWPWPVANNYSINESDSLTSAEDSGAANIIFANEFIVSEKFRSFPSFFWGRNPVLLSYNWSNLGVLERQYSTNHIGVIHNEHQSRYRTNLSDKYIDYFRLFPFGSSEILSQEEYVKLLKQSRFTVCTPGFGPKCNREIEAAACGSVLIAHKLCDLDNYYEPLVEGVHYLRFNEDSGADIPDLISSLKPDDVQFMSDSIFDWYKRNSSFDGAFDVFSSVISKI